MSRELESFYFKQNQLKQYCKQLNRLEIKQIKRKALKQTRNKWEYTWKDLTKPKCILWKHQRNAQNSVKYNEENGEGTQIYHTVDKEKKTILLSKCHQLISKEPHEEINIHGDNKNSD